MRKKYGIERIYCHTSTTVASLTPEQSHACKECWVYSDMGPRLAIKEEGEADQHDAPIPSSTWTKVLVKNTGHLKFYTGSSYVYYIYVMWGN